MQFDDVERAGAWCSPSTFCVMMPRTRPPACSSATARCPALGRRWRSSASRDTTAPSIGAAPQDPARTWRTASARAGATRPRGRDSPGSRSRSTSRRRWARPLPPSSTSACSASSETVAVTPPWCLTGRNVRRPSLRSTRTPRGCSDAPARVPLRLAARRRRSRRCVVGERQAEVLVHADAVPTGSATKAS